MYTSLNHKKKYFSTKKATSLHLFQKKIFLLAVLDKNTNIILDFRIMKMYYSCTVHKKLFYYNIR